jgi:hypothetical protein
LKRRAIVIRRAAAGEWDGVSPPASKLDAQGCAFGRGCRIGFSNWINSPGLLNRKSGRHGGAVGFADIGLPGFALPPAAKLSFFDNFHESRCKSAGLP